MVAYHFSLCRCFAPKLLNGDRRLGKNPTTGRFQIHPFFKLPVEQELIMAPDVFPHVPDQRLFFLRMILAHAKRQETAISIMR